MSGDLSITGKPISQSDTTSTTMIQGQKYYRMHANGTGRAPVLMMRSWTNASNRDQMTQVSNEGDEMGSEEIDLCCFLQMIFPPCLWNCVEWIITGFKNLWESIFPPPPAPARPALEGRLSIEQRKTLSQTLNQTMTGTMQQISYPCVLAWGVKVMVPTGGKKQYFDTEEYAPIYMAKISAYYSQFDAQKQAEQMDKFDREVNLIPVPPDGIVHISSLAISHDPKRPDKFGYVIENMSLRGSCLTLDKADNPEKGKSKDRDFYKDDIALLIAATPGLNGQMQFSDLFHTKKELFRLRNSSLETDVVIWSASPNPPGEVVPPEDADTAIPAGKPEGKRSIEGS